MPSAGPALEIVASSRPPELVPNPASPLNASYLLVKDAGILVLTGIGAMIAGTTIVHAALIPRIYSCPGGATCPYVIDPKSSFFPLVQTLMQYWLQIGATIAGSGLVKLIAHQAWLIMHTEGNTIEALDRNVGAIKGRASDAAKLMLDQRTGNRWLGVFAASQIAIGATISLIVGLSVSGLRSRGDVRIYFHYAENFTLPRADRRFFNTDGQRAIINQLDDWLLIRDELHGNVAAFEGTLVLRDNRTVYAVDAHPRGPKITSTLLCGDVGGLRPNVSYILSNSSYLEGKKLPENEQVYNITYNSTWFAAYSSSRLASAFVNTGELDGSVIRSQYLWFSNTTGLIPNATKTPDGRDYALCNHTISMTEIAYAEGASTRQYLNSSRPVIAPRDSKTQNDIVCPSHDATVCVAFSVDDLITAWWESKKAERDLIPISCSGDVLTPYDENDTICALDSTTWSSTVVIMLDAIVKAAPTSGNLTQYLLASTQSISAQRWWLQGIIPIFTFLLYLVCVGYTLYISRVSQEYAGPRELNLLEVVAAAQALEDVRDLAQRGGLREWTTVGPVPPRQRSVEFTHFRTKGGT